MALLLRYQLFLSIGVTFMSVWYACLISYNNNNGKTWTMASSLVPYAPLWAILALAIYGISSIAIGLMNFKDFPEAAVEIEQQVKEAKEAMAKRGIVS